MPDSRSGGLDRIDLVVVSHHHADHCGGMDAVIRTFTPRVSPVATGLALPALPTEATPASSRPGSARSRSVRELLKVAVIAKERLEQVCPSVDVKSRGPNAPDHPRSPYAPRAPLLSGRVQAPTTRRIVTQSMIPSSIFERLLETVELISHHPDFPGKGQAVDRCRAEIEDMLDGGRNHDRPA